MVVPVDVRSQPVTSDAGPAAALAFGLLAGVVLLAAQVVAALVTGAPPDGPLRFAASVALGSPAVEGPPAFGGLFVGALVHLALSGAYGWLYGALQGALRPGARARYGGQALVGALFGLLLWALNLQVVARAAYPWFLDAPQALQAGLHALAFGLPLGLLFAAAAAAPGRRARSPAKQVTPRRREPAAR